MIFEAIAGNRSVNLNPNLEIVYCSFITYTCAVVPETEASRGRRRTGALTFAKKKTPIKS